VNRVAVWVQESRRFRAFAESYQGKIRKKHRTAQGEAGLRDLLFELETAYRLIQDQRFAVEYEKYTAEKTRGPDFTVTFRTNTPFNLEVTRVRLHPSPNEAANHEAFIVGKLMEAACDKLGQMQPSSINILLLTSEGEMEAAHLVAALTGLRTLAERKADDFFRPRSFKNAADFIRQFHRLSGVVYCRGDQQAMWSNALAKHPIPKELASALQKAWPPPA
jgi:hypothetical protein